MTIVLRALVLRNRSRVCRKNRRSVRAVLPLRPALAFPLALRGRPLLLFMKKRRSWRHGPWEEHPGLSRLRSCEAAAQLGQHVRCRGILDENAVNESIKKLKEQNELDYAELIKLFSNSKVYEAPPTIIPSGSDS